MGRRRSKSANPLIVAAAAITRSLDPADPSKVTIIRLLGDALILLEEALQGEAPSNPDGEKSVGPVASKPHIVGAQALAAAAFTCLMRLGARGGPLRRRAIRLFRRSVAFVKDPQFLHQAVLDARTHIATMKKDAQRPKEEFEQEIAAALLVLAEASVPRLAGLSVAKDSVLFILGPKVKHKAARSDIALAASHIIAAHDHEHQPDRSLIETATDYAIAGASTKLGMGGVGCATLVSALCPFITSGDKAVYRQLSVSCAKALSVAPNQLEKNCWAVAVARTIFAAFKCCSHADLAAYICSAAINAGATELNKRAHFDIFDGFSGRFAAAIGDQEATHGASDDLATFSASICTAASLCCFKERAAGCTWAIAAVLRAWAVCSPPMIADLVQRVVLLVRHELVDSLSVAILHEAVIHGISDYVDSRNAREVVDSLLRLTNQGKQCMALSLLLCRTFVLKYGRDALAACKSSESATQQILHVSQVALSDCNPTMRHCGLVSLLAIFTVVSECRAPLFTLVLQSMKIADLQLTTNHHVSTLSSAEALAACADDLAALLGSASALTGMVAESIMSDSHESTLSSALLAQCSDDALSLLHGHPALGEENVCHPVLQSVRRRLGWILLASLFRVKQSPTFREALTDRLSSQWMEELGFPLDKQIDCETTGFRALSLQALFPEMPKALDKDGSGLEKTTAHVLEILERADLELFVCRSACRAASICALVESLKNCQGSSHKHLASILVGACFARLAFLEAGFPALDNGRDQHSAIRGHGSTKSSVANKAATSADKVNWETTTSDHSPFEQISSSTVKIPRKLPRGNPSKKTSSSRKLTRLHAVARRFALEALQLLSLAQTVPLSEDVSSSCFSVATALSDEAQRVLESAVGFPKYSEDTSAQRSSSYVISSQFWGVEPDGFVMSARHRGLYFGRQQDTSRSSCCSHVPGFVDFEELDHMERFNHLPGLPVKMSGDLQWLFTTDDPELPLANSVLVVCANAIASLMANETSSSDLVYDSLQSSAVSSPALCSSIAYAVARRVNISCSHSAGRLLALVQVLLKRAHEGIVSFERAASKVLTKHERPLPNLHPRCVDVESENIAVSLSSCEENSGCLWQSSTYATGWIHWARRFTAETLLFQNANRSEEARVLAHLTSMLALTAETYKLLAVKGGERLWAGLIVSTTRVLKQSLIGNGTSQRFHATLNVMILGALTEAMPCIVHECEKVGMRSHAIHQSTSVSDRSARQDLETAAQIAFEVLASALESDRAYFRYASIAAVEDVSPSICNQSERLFSAIVESWASDQGSFQCSASETRLIEEITLSHNALRSAGAGFYFQKALLARAPYPFLTNCFFSFEPQGPGSCAGVYATAALAVLASSRDQVYALDESFVGVVEELASEFLSWDPKWSPQTVSSGLYCLSSLWAVRMEMEHVSQIQDTSTEHDLLSPRSSASRLRGMRKMGVNHPNVPQIGKESPRSPLLVPDRRASKNSMRQRFEFTNTMRDQDQLSSFRGRINLERFSVSDMPVQVILERLCFLLRRSAREAQLYGVKRATLTALSEMILGYGASSVLQICSDIPEVLFLVANYVGDVACQLLQRLAKDDVLLRPDYWLTLCCDVFWGRRCSGYDSQQERTEHTLVPARQRALALATLSTILGVIPEYFRNHLRSETIALKMPGTHKMTAASPSSNDHSDQSSDHLLWQVVLERLSNVFSVASSAMRESSFLPDVAAHGCRIVQLLFHSVTYLSNDAMWRAFCSSFCQEQVFEALQICWKEARCPEVVIQSARAIGSWLAAVARLPEFSKSSHVEDLFRALMEYDRIDGNVRYILDQCSESAGGRVVFELLENVALVVNSLRESTFNSSRPTLQTLLASSESSPRNILMATVGDFSFSLFEGVERLSSCGGSLVSSNMSPQLLRSLLSEHLPMIVCGSMAYWDEHRLPSVSDAGDEVIQWRNAWAPGALLVSRIRGKKSALTFSVEQLLVAVWTWLISRGSLKEAVGRTSLDHACEQFLWEPNSGGWTVYTENFMEHSLNSLPFFLLQEHFSIGLWTEALSALKSFNSMYVTEMCHRAAQIFSMKSRSSKHIAVDYHLLIKQCYCICIEELLESPSDADIGTVFATIESLLSEVEPNVHEACAAEVLDITLFLLNLPPGIKIRQLSRRSTQKQISNVVAKCFALSEERHRILFVQELLRVVERVQTVDSVERLVAATSILAYIGQDSPILTGRLAVSFLCVREQALDAMLICDGGQRFLLSCMKSDGSIHDVITAPQKELVFVGVMSRMTLARGPPRHSAAEIFLKIHACGNAPPMQEVILSSLFPQLCKDALEERLGSRRCLHNLLDIDSAVARTHLKAFIAHERAENRKRTRMTSI